MRKIKKQQGIEGKILPPTEWSIGKGCWEIVRSPVDSFASRWPPERFYLHPSSCLPTGLGRGSLCPQWKARRQNKPGKFSKIDENKKNLRKGSRKKTRLVKERKRRKRKRRRTRMRRTLTMVKPITKMKLKTQQKRLMKQKMNKILWKTQNK